MKKSLSLLLSLCLAVSLTACGTGSTAGNALESNVPGPATQLAKIARQDDLPFTDIPADAAYEEAVEWCYENGLMTGVSNTTFAPENSLTRAMLAAVLYRASGSPDVTGTDNFTDTVEGSWYSNSVLWAAQQGLVAGYGNGLFGIDDPVSVEQMEVIMGRYTGNGPDWVGDPSKAHAATRAQVATALYANLSNHTDNPSTDHPTVYMTTDISSDGLMAIYEALNANPEGKIAVKLSTGEPGSNYLRTDLIGDLVQSLDASIVECNTAYGGSRSNTAMHRQVAADHGYTAIATVDIMDEEGEVALPVTGGDNLKENYVGSHFSNYDYYVVLSHFKGHSMAGYGGAIKNISIGIASSHGKSHIHSGGIGGNMWGGDQNAFLESMAEAGKSVVDALDGNILYINVMNRLSVDCDCDGNPAAPDMHDIGILASYDPVALDQACVDLVYSAQDGSSLIRRIESRNGIHTLEQAAKIGLGSREYELVSIDS